MDGGAFVSLEPLWFLSGLLCRLVSFVGVELALAVNGGVGDMNVSLVVDGIDSGMVDESSLDSTAGMMGS